MLKTLKSGHRLCRVYRGVRGASQKRLFLSDAYRCEEAWDRRLDTPLLRKIDPQTMFIELEQKQSSAGKVSAVDVDIFVNSLTSDSYADELLKILHGLRLSAETSNTLDSTHHAAIRYLLRHGYVEELHEMLNDRLNYGIFPDYFDYNVLMDHFIKRRDHASAAKIATLVMLQEEHGNPITNALCVHSCFKYLENPDEWKKPEVPEDKSEEVKVRVRYLRNPYFDDHFDLTDPRDLVGKTLDFQGKHRTDALGRTCRLRGLVLRRKYDDAAGLIKEWLETMRDGIVYEEAFELISKDNSGLQDQDAEKFKAVEADLSDLKKRQNLKESLTEAIENLVKAAVSEQAEKDIAKQCQTYLDWEGARISVLEAQMKAIEREKRIANIEKIKKDLQEREQLLTFFDKEEEIELQIERLEELDRKEDERIRRMWRSAKKLRLLVQAENYIPPEVQSRK